MVRVSRRRKTVFDQECTRVYATLIGYLTLDEARANIIQIARGLGITRKSLGGYLTQSATNPRVFEYLRKLGYTESQIPQWFQRPINPVAVQPQPRVVQVETNPTRQTPRASMPAPQEGQVGGVGTPIYLTSKRKILVGDEPMWEKVWSDGSRTRQPLTGDELADYQERVRAQDLEEYRRWEKSQQREESRPKEPTPEEKKPEKVEEPVKSEKPVKAEKPIDLATFAVNYEIMRYYRTLQQDIAKAKRRSDIEELKKTFADAVKPPAAKPDTTKPIAQPPKETPKPTPIKLVNISELRRQQEKDNIDFIKGIGGIYADLQKKKDTHAQESIARFYREEEARNKAFYDRLNEYREQSRRRRSRRN